MKDDKQAQGKSGEPGSEAPRPQESGGASGPGVGDGKPKRFTAKRKLEAVQRLMGGESLEAVSRELGVPVARLSEWRDQALASAEAGLKSQSRDARDDEIARLQSKVGEVTMDKELLEEKVRKLEGKSPLGSGRSRS